MSIPRPTSKPGFEKFQIPDDTDAEIPNRTQSEPHTVVGVLTVPLFGRTYIRGFESFKSHGKSHSLWRMVRHVFESIGPQT